MKRTTKTKAQRMTRTKGPITKRKTTGQKQSAKKASKNNVLAVISNSPPKNKVGAPTLYKPEFVVVARHMTSLGATAQQIAEACGVQSNTICTWEVRHREFAHALKIGEGEADDRVKRSLFHKCIGYHVKETRAFKVKDDNGTERVEVVEIEKYIPGDTVASIFWLKNRQPQDWQDVHKMKHTGADGKSPIQVEATFRELSDEALAKIGEVIEGEYSREPAGAETG